MRNRFSAFIRLFLTLFSSLIEQIYTAEVVEGKSALISLESEATNVEQSTPSSAAWRLLGPSHFKAVCCDSVT